MVMFRFWFLPLTAIGALAEECEDTAGAGASWIQMKIQYQLAKKVSNEGYFWVKRGADRFTSSAINWTVPDISQNATWIWPNAGDEQVRHSPLIDDALNIYVATTTQIRKFDSSGQVLWTWKIDGKMVSAPALHQGKIYALSGCGTGTMDIYAVHISNGTADWNATMPGQCNGEANSILAVRDTLVLPLAFPDNTGGANGARAVSTSNGNHLWDFLTDDIFWNFAPSAADESLIFSSSCGMAYRISLDKGELMWKNGFRPPGPPQMCGTGGGAVGPNGVLYSEYNPTHDAEAGRVTAFNASNGQVLWQKEMEKGYKGIQYPSIGYLGSGERLAVVVGVGDNPSIPPLLMGEQLERYLTDPEYREAMQVPHFKNRVMALDASNGETLWQYEEPVWDHFGAAGDEEVFLKHTLSKTIEGAICLPDAQGIPVINQLDGTVFFSSSHYGNLTAINDANNNGIIESDEVKSFAPGVAFLNSPSMAPGMLVAAPCWGPTYVWKQ